MTNVNVKPKEIPTWAKKSRKNDVGDIFFDGRLRRYRADLLGGYFRCSDREDSAIGANLDLQIIDYRWINESRYRYGNQANFDIAFIDQQSVASCLSLTRDSAVNLAEWIRNLSIGESPIFPEALLCILDMEKIATESGTPYHVVFVKDWKFVDEAQFLAAKEFKNSPKYIANQWQGVY